MRPGPCFALNHMAAPGLDVPAFFALARSLGITGVEIRNDLGDGAPAGGLAAHRVRAAAAEAGVEILSINALQRFNDWNSARAAEATALADYAAACGARALVLVPVNDGSLRADGERQHRLRIALEALRPLLAQRRLVGLVEPLGFASCSLRLKREAVEAIDTVGGSEVFRLVHDTFHHAVAGERELFCELTGLVHVSGVSDPALDLSDMRDEHRELVGTDDRIGNVDQIRALLAGGYAGAFSFEPFAPQVHERQDIAGALSASIDFIKAALSRAPSALPG